MLWRKNSFDSVLLRMESLPRNNASINYCLRWLQSQTWSKLLLCQQTEIKPKHKTNKNAGNFYKQTSIFIFVSVNSIHRRNSLHGNVVHQACYHWANKIYIVKYQIGLYSYHPKSIPFKEFLLFIDLYHVSGDHFIGNSVKVKSLVLLVASLSVTSYHVF